MRLDLLLESIGVGLGIMAVATILSRANVARRRLFRRRRSVRQVPGRRVDALLRFLYPKSIYDEVFQQTMADFEDEYIEALKDDANWRARWRRLQLYLSIGKSVVAHAWSKTVAAIVRSLIGPS